MSCNNNIIGNGTKTGETLSNELYKCGLRVIIGNGMETGAKSE